MTAAFLKVMDRKRNLLAIPLHRIRAVRRLGNDDYLVEVVDGHDIVALYEPTLIEDESVDSLEVWCATWPALSLLPTWTRWPVSGLSVEVGVLSGARSHENRPTGAFEELADATTAWQASRLLVAVQSRLCLSLGIGEDGGWSGDIVKACKETAIGAFEGEGVPTVPAANLLPQWINEVNTAAGSQVWTDADKLKPQPIKRKS
jgi:hypothetical protein